MILANRNDHMSIKTSQAILKGCLENDDLENDDLQNDDLQNDDLENGDQFLKIIVKQKKIGKRKNKREQRTFIREKGDTWREVWLEVNRVSLQALSLFAYFAIKMQMSYS